MKLSVFILVPFCGPIQTRGLDTESISGTEDSNTAQFVSLDTC